MHTLFAKAFSAASLLVLATATAQAATLVHEVGGEPGATIQAEHAPVSTTRSSVTQELMQARAKYPAWNQQLMGAPNETPRATPRTRNEVAREARAAVAGNAVPLREYQ